MPYLNLDPNYFDHPKTRRLVASLGPGADVLPIRLWAYCARYHPNDGRMKGYTIPEVESIMGWTGEPGSAIKSMGRVGFILGHKSGFQCIDWLQHQGHLAAFSRRGKAANKVRWDKVRAGIPVGVHKSSLSDPPYHTIPAIPSIPSKQITDRPVRAIFIPPSIEEVRAYTLSQKNVVDAEHWFDYYSARGWMLGKTKMKDWKAAVRTWEKNNYGNQNGKTGRERIVGGAAPVPGKYDHLGK